MGFFERFKPASDENLEQLKNAQEERNFAQKGSDYEQFKLQHLDTIREIDGLQVRVELAATDEERKEAQKALGSVKGPLDELLRAKREELGLTEKDVD